MADPKFYFHSITRSISGPPTKTTVRLTLVRLSSGRLEDVTLTNDDLAKLVAQGSAALARQLGVGI